MSWESFDMYALSSGVCWIIGAFLAFKGYRTGALSLSGIGSAIFLYLL